MEHFLINSSVCLFVLWLVYKLLLENTSWHVFKRVYLLGAIIISVVIPFLVVKTVFVPVQELPVLEFQNSMAVPQVTHVTAETGFAIDWVYVALGLYLLGVCIMLFRFTKNLLAFKIQKNDVVSNYASYPLILRGEVTVPHSFWNRIFVSKKQYEQDLIPKVVLEHEKTHLDQKHSLDVLFVELLLVLFWFNPVLYLLRYAIKLNHEFLADQAVLKTGISTTDYQELILNHASSHYQHAIANTFHFPLIKKRFNIMKTQTSHTSLLLRSLAIIPVLALLIISCGREEIVVEPKKTEPTEIIENNDNVPISKLIVIDRNIPTANVTIDGKSYHYKISDNKITIFDLKGNLQDFEKQGYKILFEDEITEIVEQAEVTVKQIDEYNRLAKEQKEYMSINKSIMVNAETIRMQTIYKAMSDEQRTKNEPWPFLGKHYGVEYRGGELPPPPPPPPPLDSAEAKGNAMNGTIVVAGKKHYFKSDDNNMVIYDEFGKMQDIDPNARNIDEITVYGKNNKDQKTRQPRNDSESTKIELINKNAITNLKLDMSNLSLDEQKQYKLRNTFIYASEQTNGAVTFYTDNNLASGANARAFLKDNPFANVSLKQNNNLTELHFNKSSNKMTDTQLQTVYTELFELTKNKMNKGGSFIITKVNNLP